jgi:glycosyltransferase involved in cell wall biosynthesis
MRITVIASSYPRFPGDGTAPFVQSICEGLAALGHAVEVVAPYDQAVTPAPGPVAVRRYRYAPRREWHIMGHAKALAGDTRFRGGVFLLLPFFLLAGLAAAWRTARRLRADVIHAHWVLPGGLVGAWVAAALRVPLAVSLHGSDVFVAQRSALLGRVAGWVFRRAAVITACSPELAAGAVALGADATRVHLVAWGADPQRFHPAIEPADRAALGAEASDLLVASLGRMVPKKGFDVLVRALPALAAAEPRLRLVIGGDGPQREELHRLAQTLGVADRLLLPGQVPWNRVPAFLAASDLFVLPSQRDPAGNLDGLPTVLLEAMAMGKAVVATRIGGTPLVIKDGVNGVLCPAGDAAALSAALARLLGDEALRLRLGQAARRSVEERFNWAAVAQQLSELFATASKVVR